MGVMDMGAFQSLGFAAVFLLAAWVLYSAGWR